MSTLSLHLAIHTANIEIRKATRASDDYAYASTETLFNALWEIAPQVEYSDKPWEISLGGDSSGSWVAKIVKESAPHHKMLILSSCNKSVVIEPVKLCGDGPKRLGVWMGSRGVQIFDTLGDDLRHLIQNVIREGDFYGDEPTAISRMAKVSAKEVFDLLNVSDAKPLDELPPPDVWMAELKEVLDSKYPNGRAEDVDAELFKGPVKEGFIPSELVGSREGNPPTLTATCRALTDLDPERRKEIIDGILGPNPGMFRSGSVGQRWQPIGGKELAKNLREYQEEQRSKLPRDAEGNVADFVPDDSPTR